MKTLAEVRSLVGKLPEASLPLALLPVQVQTRYATRSGSPHLLVRVFPDELHVDGHDERLSAAEVRWGQRSWELAWPKAGDPDAERAAWQPVADRFGARRAEWIARRLRPTNLDRRPRERPAFRDHRPFRRDDVVEPARARLLPDRWIVAGYQAGRRVLLEAGAPIPKELPIGPSFDDQPLPSVGPEELALDAGMRWLVDFRAAERVGMGIRVALPSELAGTKFDTLLVFGVRAGLAPRAAGAELEALLDANRHTGGLAFLAPATPTNNTAEATSAFSRRDRAVGASFETGPPTATKASDGVAAARGLGLRVEALAGIEGADRRDDLDARHVHTALWAVTGGYYLDQVMAAPEGQPATFSDEELEQARRYFVDFVRPLGPLPMLRVGRQPYGLLPVTSLDLVAASPEGQGRFVPTLRFLRDAARAALPGVPRLGAGGQDPDGLVEILRQQPASVGYRARLAFDGRFFTPTGVFDSSLSPHLQSHQRLLRGRLQGAIAAGLARDERFFQLIPADASTRLGAPLVAPLGASPGAVLDPNYIAFLRTASFDDILHERLPAGFPPPAELGAVLYLLLRHSVLLAYATTARRILVRRGRLPKERHREPVLVDIAGGAEPAPTATLLRAVALDPALRATLHTLTAAQEPEAALLDELRQSLRHLQALPVEVLDRHLRGCLDAWSYRLDAWITSLATRRLRTLRRERPRGLGLGAFGWVEDLQPSPRSPVAAPPGEDGALSAAREPGGFVHAPSMAQASAAAVLRSGYLAHAGGADAGALAIDLGSERVRLAEALLDGIRQGRSLGSLLGYRFERQLHEARLDRFIAGFRRVSVLAPVYRGEARLREAQALPRGPDRFLAVRAAERALANALAALRERYGLAPAAGVAQMEPVAAANVADGLALVRLAQGDGVPFGRLGIAVGGDRPRLDAELAALAAALDALSDALTAESVYQLVRGNPARASAGVDAVAHAEIPPPELQFPQTPRPGATLTHRLVVLLSGRTPAVGAGVRHARRAAEPRLDAWLRQMAGDPRHVRCRAEFVGPGGEVVLARDDVRLGDIGVSNLDVLHLTAAGEPGLPSDLERLLEHHLRRQAPALAPDARLRLDYARPARLRPRELGLGEFLEVTAAFGQAVFAARTLDGRDLAEADAGAASDVDVAELAARADRTVAALVRAHDALVRELQAAAATEPAAEPVLDALRERLVDLVFLGVPAAVPVSARGADAAGRDGLVAQGAVAERELARRRDRLRSLDDALAAAAPSPDGQVRHQLERIAAALGAGFRALPLARPANGAEVGRALAGSDDLLGGDPLQAVSWLQGVSRVRPGAARLGAALSYAAALGRPAALDLDVAQLPFASGERWVALPAGRDRRFPVGKLSLVAHLPRRFDPAQPVAGLVVDEWVETVPASETTTGVAFHYDAPGARPPQAALLAVAPSGPARWDVEALEQILLETLELARLRALDPQVLAQDALLERALPALYVTHNLAGEALSTDFARAVS